MQRTLLFLRNCMFALLALCTLAAAQDNKANIPGAVAEPDQSAKPGIAATASIPNAQNVSSASEPHIALVLPVSSGVLAPLASALRRGWVAAATFDGRNAAPYRIYAIDNEGEALAAALRGATLSGAKLVAAGLTRDGATLLARLAPSESNTGIPILALNTPDAPAPSFFYSLSLSLDNEARQTAQFASLEGAKSVAIVSGPSSLAKRIAEVFEKEWLFGGGNLAARLSFSGDPAEAPLLRAQLENLRTEAVFIAANPGTTRMARPYVPIWMQVYATSLSYDSRADTVANVDLEGVRLLEMPWFIQPDHPAVMVYPRTEAGTSVEQERLYALGIDAWRLASQLFRSDGQGQVLDGVTGKLTLGANRQFTRVLTAVEFQGGHPQLLKNPVE